MSAVTDITTDVLIIGGGPAGLTAAATLAPQVAGEVLVLEREAVAGGIPRHSDHPGYGIRDLRTFISGPAYARRLVDTARRSGALLRTQTMVTGWSDACTVEVTSPEGRQRITARAIVLATGARERPRPARLIPGDRPAGVYTTGQLQNLVHLHHATPGKRAVIVGAELVSWSAAITLRQAKCPAILITTTHQRTRSYAAIARPARLALRLPLATRTRVVRIIGRRRVEAVELENLDTGSRRTVACDTVVFTGDWIPDHELARAANLQIDPRTLGPLIDTAQATSQPGVFATGNLIHPVDTADVAALDGRAVADPVQEYLRNPSVKRSRGPRILAGPHLKWITPGILRPGTAPPRHRLLAWPLDPMALPTVTVTQNGELCSRRLVPWPASSTRVFRIPSSLLRNVDQAGTDIIVDLVTGRHG